MIQKGCFPKKWAFICLSNLFIASILGVIMRYKINFPLKIIDQSNVLHAHSHFVFEGWITLVLYCAFVRFLLPESLREKKTYVWQFWLQYISALGMLFTFFFQGYAPLSIGFSAMSQFLFYWFTIQFIIDIRKPEVSIAPIVKWFAISALIAGILSSLGTYALAYVASTGNGSPLFKRGSVYYYLHFQYNGWFSFGVFTLFFNWIIENKRMGFPRKSLRWIFALFTIGLIPGYCLSLIGYVKAFWVHGWSFFAVATQVIALIILTKEIIVNRKNVGIRLSMIEKVLWGIAFLSFFTKTVLQGLSLHPDLAIIAFSLRPLVIGYLHLIFICMISFFLFGFLFHHAQLKYAHSKLAKWGLLLFVISSIMNEFGLFLQAAGFYFTFHFPHIPLYLYYITIIMSISLLLFCLGQLKKDTELNLKHSEERI